MSLSPYFLDYYRPSRLLGQDFGLELNPNEIIYPLVNEFFRPHHLVRSPSHQDAVKRDPNKFQVCLDVHQFAPNEIVVKTIGREIVVQGKHEERQDEHGYISRHFVRKYAIPEGHEPNEVFSTLSSDGILTITAPRDPIILPDKNERIVPITQTGPVHHEVREHTVEHLPESRKKHIHNHGDSNENEHYVPLAIKYI